MHPHTVVGSETEWAVVITDRDGRNIDLLGSPGRAKEFMRTCVPEELRFTRFLTEIDFLRNGARFYLDTGHHPEYATPEVLAPGRSIVMAEKAGERIVEEIIKRVNALWNSQGYSARAFKNNIDSRGNAYGAHENYAARRDQFPFNSVNVWHLMKFLVSRQLFTGNGGIRSESNHLRYMLSQRALVTHTTLGGGTTANRGIINTRDEPLADGALWRRIHLVVGDANIAEVALYLKYAITAMVLDMIEEGYLPKPTRCDDFELLLAFREFSQDPTLQKTCKINDRRLTVVNAQEEFRDHLRTFYQEYRDITLEHEYALDLLDTILELAKLPDPHIGLSPYCDWAAKQVFIESVMAKNHFWWDASADTPLKRKVREDAAAAGGEDPKQEKDTVYGCIKAIDFRYHENSSRGHARKMNLERVVTDEEIKAVQSRVPKLTRAHARTSQLCFLEDEQERVGTKFKFQVHVDWVTIETQSRMSPMYSARNGDPFDPDQKFISQTRMP